MLNKTQVSKKRFVFEQYRQTSQRMMNVRKKQFKSFEISAEEISFQIMIFLSILNAFSFTVGINEY